MNLYLPQPAYKIYAFDRGWRVLRYVVQHLFERTNFAAKQWMNRAEATKRWSMTQPLLKKYWAWVLMLGFWIAGGTQYISATPIAALFAVVQAILLLIWATIALVGMGLLSVFTFLYAKYYRIFCRCPDCHKDMPLPLYICSGCGTEHSRLWPSIYGVFLHRCKTCETKLPTIGFLGRRRLRRICAECKRPLNMGVGVGTNVHIPIIGGPSAGKTNYIVMATHMFKQTFEHFYHYNVAFTDVVHQHTFEANMQRLEGGRELQKTTDIVPQAYNLKIRAPRTFVPKLAYVYDAAGEAFNKNEYTSRQEYYKYIDGIVFVIDPCAIATYRRIHQADIDAIRDLIRPSVLDVMQAYERMIQMFEASKGVRKRTRYTQPVAVVVTKVDALNLEEEIGFPAARRLMNTTASHKTEEDAIHALVRDFLFTYDLDHFVRDLESQFSNVRYFSCSALGRLPRENDVSSFVPIRVLEPLTWLLARSKVIKPVRHIPSLPTIQQQPLMMKQKI